MRRQVLSRTWCFDRSVSKAALPQPVQRLLHSQLFYTSPNCVDILSHRYTVCVAEICSLHEGHSTQVWLND